MSKLAEREALEQALRQWRSYYCDLHDSELETANHAEGNMYRWARRALEGE